MLTKLRNSRVVFNTDTDAGIVTIVSQTLDGTIREDGMSGRPGGATIALKAMPPQCRYNR
jgi:hypothetical protein